MNTEQVTSAMNNATHLYAHYSRLFLTSELGQFITHLPIGVLIAGGVWLVLMVFSPKFRNPDTNPIILSIVKIIAIVFVVGWMMRVEINYRKAQTNV